jgi:hypothetical protein
MTFKPDDWPDHGDLEARCGEGVCDFCVPALPSLWIYPAKSFQLAGTGSIGGRANWSNGGWGACHICADLIEENDHEALARRAPLNFLIGIGTKWVDQFFDHRDGERYLAHNLQSEHYGETRITPGFVDIPDSERPRHGDSA